MRLFKILIVPLELQKDITEGIEHESYYNKSKVIVDSLSTINYVAECGMAFIEKYNKLYTYDK